MRKAISWLIGIVILCVAFYFSAKIVDSKKLPSGVVKKVVKTAFVDTVKNTTIPIALKVNGSLSASQKVELYSEVAGVFKSSKGLFKAGETYRKGDLLIGIDGSEFYASIRSRRSDLFNLITGAMPDIRLDYPDYFPKWQKYLAEFNVENTTQPLPEFESDQEKFFISGKGIVQTFYSIKNLEERYSKYMIRAPFSGALTEALVNKGTLVRAGQKLGEFIDPSAYEMEVAVNKSYMDLLEVGKTVDITSLDNSKNWKGTLVRVNGRVDQASQTVTCYIQVKGADLREGMYLQAHLEGADQQNAYEISRKLLIDNSKVFAVSDTLLTSVPVEPLFFTETTVVVRGIKDGTQILEQSIPGAYEGMLVKIYTGK